MNFDVALQMRVLPILPCDYQSLRQWIEISGTIWKAKLFFAVSIFSPSLLLCYKGRFGNCHSGILGGIRQRYYQGFFNKEEVISNHPRMGVMAGLHWAC
jgi:hypothetical protein